MDIAASPTSLAEPRRRLLDAMSHTVARKGYAGATIGDLAAHARVSRRTFYEHFATKDECLIALYEAASDQALAVLQAAIDPERDLRRFLEEARVMDRLRHPNIVRVNNVDRIEGKVVIDMEYVRGQNLQEMLRQEGPQPLPASFAMAIVGAINELILQAIENDRVAELPALTGVAAQIARALIDGAA